MLGITFRGAQGLGDKLQFSSFPENYFRNTGEKVVDVDRAWIFDHNPHVIRDAAPDRVIDLWTAPWPLRQGMTHQQYAAKPVFFSLAERTSSIFNHTAYLRHPRLYQFEDLPRLDRRVVLHTTGKSIPPQKAQGEDAPRILSGEIIEHVRSVYRDHEIVQVGSKEDVDAGVVDCRGIPDIWEVVRIIAQAGTFIGVDSGPYWIAACFPRIFRKKVLMQYPPDYLRRQFVPMHIINLHVHWHDLSCLYFNRSRDDAGVTYSFLKL
jgi:hypothetical protein